MLEGINNTKQYVRAETTDALRGIWDDAKPSIDLFLQDLKHLRVIEQDFEEFKTFLNRSYYANEFYIRDIVNISMLMFDELALKSHFESLPAIVSEVWQIMGSSGSKIKTSILWVIEKVTNQLYQHYSYSHYYINICLVFLKRLALPPRRRFYFAYLNLDKPDYLCGTNEFSVSSL